MLRNKLKIESVEKVSCCHCEPRRGEAISKRDCFVGLRSPRNDGIGVLQRFQFLVLSCSFAFLLLTFAFLFAQEQFVYDSHGRRNPFTPLLTPDGRFLSLEQEEAPEGLLLEGIIYDKHGRSFAIVNGVVLGVGDSIGDYQILKVEERRVICIKDGEPKEIELKKEEP